MGPLVREAGVAEASNVLKVFHGRFSRGMK